MGRLYRTGRGRVSNAGDLPRFIGLLPSPKADDGVLVYSSVTEMYVGLFLDWSPEVIKIAYEPEALEVSNAASADAMADDITQLLALRVITPRTSREVGHDADELLRAREYLDALVGIDGLSKLVGVRVSEGDLQPMGLFPRWNPHARGDARVAPERVLELHRALTVLWHRARTPTDRVSLRALANSSPHPFAVVEAAVKSITAGLVTHFAWKPPFAWVDLEIEREELALIGRA